MKKFSDFAEEETQFAGDKVPIEKLVNVPIIVKDYRVSDSKFKKTNSDKCMTMLFEYPDQPGKGFVLFTGSNVLINQCDKYKDMMPFETVIAKINKYYAFT